MTFYINFVANDKASALAHLDKQNIPESVCLIIREAILGIRKPCMISVKAHGHICDQYDEYSLENSSCLIEVNPIFPV